MKTPGTLFRVALSLFALAWPLAGGASEAARVYVVRPKLVGIGETALPAVMDAVGQAASDEGLQAFTEADAQTILQREAQLQKLGADADELSLQTLGKAVGANHLLVVTVSKNGDDTRVFMRLLDVGKGSVLSRREVRAADHDGDLVATLKVATRLTLAPIFASHKGTLSIQASEEGANVLVDGEQVGVTPTGTLTLTGGFHLLTLTKESFIRHQETLRVNGGEQLLRIIKLRPSPEFLQSYRTRNTRYRRLAWTTTGVGAVLLGSTVATSLLLMGQNAETRRLEDTYNGLPPREQAAQQATMQQQIQESAARAGHYENASFGLGAGAVVAGLLAGYFWIWGENPDRYAEFEPAR